MGAWESLQKRSLSTTDTSSTIGCAGSNGRTKGPLEQHPGPVAEPSLALPHPKRAVFLSCLVNGLEYGLCCLQNLKGPTGHCSTFLVVGGARCNNLSFNLEGISPHVLHPWTARNFTHGEGLQILVGIISYPVACKCPTNKCKAVATCRSRGPISIMSSLWWISLISCGRER